jgi:hypothetical protein
LSARPAGCGFLLLRRGGVLWGIDNAAVAGLTRGGEGYRIDVGASSAGRALAADEILCVVDDLRVWPVAPAVRRFWPVAGVAGVAVHGAQPLVVADPRRPPRALWLEPGPDESDEGEEEGRDGKRRD